MDPVTGLTPRAAVALSIVVVLGIAASTAVTLWEEGGDPGCPDHRFGCAIYEQGEPIPIGALFDRGVGRFGVAAAVYPHATVLGRRVTVLGFDSGCSPETASEAARELASDPPDEPPAVGVVGDACSAAEIPAVQILEDRGTTFVTGGSPVRVPGGAEFYLSRPTPGSSAPAMVHLDTPRQLGPTELAAYEAARALVRAVEAVALEHEGDLLVPRSQLRDVLVREGLVPAASLAGPDPPT